MIITKENWEIKECKPIFDFKLAEDIYNELVMEAKKAPYCVGLAAPQIGYPYRMFIYKVGKGIHATWKVVVNPEIDPNWQSHLIKMTEGCLSVPNKIGEVERLASIQVTYSDLNGNKFVNKLLSGFEARVFQHEHDHLKGRFFDDIATNIMERK